MFHPSAQQLNSWIEAAERVDAAPGKKRRGAAHNPNVIRIRNDSGADLADPRPILAIGEPILDPSDADGEAMALERPVFEGLPWDDADADFRKFAVLQGPVEEDRTTEAIMCGLTWVKVNVTADTDLAVYAYAEPEDESIMRLVGAGCARVIWRASGTGEKWALVTIGAYAAPVYLCKTTTAHGKGDVEDVAIYEGDESTAQGSESSASESVPAYNRWADIDSDKWGKIRWSINRNGFALINGEC